MRYTITNHNPNRYTAQPVRSMIKSRQWNPIQDNRNKMTFNRVICKYERRAEDAKQKRQHCNINNNQQYNISHDDNTLEAYGKYSHSWS
jgi:hypothetical protein